MRVGVATKNPRQDSDFRTAPSGVTWLVPGGPGLNVLPAIPESDPEVTRLLRPWSPLWVLRARFQTPEPLWAPAGPGMTLTQTYVFTSYSASPNHEPSAQLRAARFYPLLTFSFTPSSDPPPVYFRADYRVELAFSRELVTPMSPGPQGPIQAGVFADDDEVFKATSVTRLKILASLLKTDALFRHAEKPVIYELRGIGLRSGSAGSVAGDWDNVHLWPLQSRPDRELVNGVPFSLPSVPGAFHAAHSHWRWYKEAVKPTELPPILPGGAQFASLAGVAGGPMVDDRNQNQSLLFALTEASRWGPEDEWSRSPLTFEAVAKGLPRSIQPGANLALLVTIEVFRDIRRHPPSEEWSGSLFVHGFFFAHEEEPYAVDSPRRAPMVKPGRAVAQSWDRVP